MRSDPPKPKLPKLTVSVSKTARKESTSEMEMDSAKTRMPSTPDSSIGSSPRSPSSTSSTSSPMSVSSTTSTSSILKQMPSLDTEEREQKRAREKKENKEWLNLSDRIGAGDPGLFEIVSDIRANLAKLDTATQLVYADVFKEMKKNMKVISESESYNSGSQNFELKHNKMICEYGISQLLNFARDASYTGVHDAKANEKCIQLCQGLQEYVEETFGIKMHSTILNQHIVNSEAEQAAKEIDVSNVVKRPGPGSGR